LSLPIKNDFDSSEVLPVNNEDIIKFFIFKVFNPSSNCCDRISDPCPFLDSISSTISSPKAALYNNWLETTLTSILSDVVFETNI
jgi:hypothetical protein